MANEKERADYLLRQAITSGINNPKELANFVAQATVETQHFSKMEEDFRYRGARLYQVFPKRNNMTPEKAEELAKAGPEAIANYVYGKSYGKEALGNTQEGDGWRFRGQGYFQVTGRANYTSLSAKIGVDLVKHPELAQDKAVAAKMAVQFWKDNVRSKGYQLDVTKATGVINKGKLHLSERKNAAAEWEQRFKDGYLEKNLGIDIKGRKASPTEKAPATDKRAEAGSEHQIIDPLYAKLDNGLRPRLAELGAGKFADAMIAETVYACVQQGISADKISYMGVSVEKNNILVAGGQHGPYAVVDAFSAAKTVPEERLQQASALQVEMDLQQALALTQPQPHQHNGPKFS